MVGKYRAVLTTGVALLLTLCSYLVNNYPEAPLKLRPIVDVLDVIQRPAKLAGFFASGNPHIPNETVIYLVLFITYWMLVGIVIWLASLVLTRKKRL